MCSDYSQPTVQFFRLLESGIPPQRADRSAGGTLPTRAFRYCEAATTAAALGWYIFPPAAFRLFWTGNEVSWTYAGASDWFPLGTAQFPGFREHFDNTVPSRLKTYSPPFIAALPEPGIVQVWSGLIAKTKPDWSLVARGPANLPRSAGFDVYEGVIEADRWFGPLFINIRLSRTGSPIEFPVDAPLFQVQPIHRMAYSNDTLNDVKIRAYSEMGEREWESYYNTIVGPSLTRCSHGMNAAEIRKRRHGEAGASLGAMMV